MAKSGIEWVEPPEKLAQNIEDYAQGLLAAVHATGAYVGQKMQDEARQNASWHDRTGNARSGLFFVVDGLGLQPLVGQVEPEKQPDFEQHEQLQPAEGGSPTRLVICLGHTMDYGWPISVGLAAAGVTFLLGRWLNHPDRVAEPRHTLFFVPMEYWGLVLGAAAVICQVTWWFV